MSKCIHFLCWCLRVNATLFGYSRVPIQKKSISRINKTRKKSAELGISASTWHPQMTSKKRETHHAHALGQKLGCSYVIIAASNKKGDFRRQSKIYNPIKLETLADKYHVKFFKFYNISYLNFLGPRQHNVASVADFKSGRLMHPYHQCDTFSPVRNCAGHGRPMASLFRSLLHPNSLLATSTVPVILQMVPI